MSSSLLGGSLRSSICAGMSISPPSPRTWSTRLVAMLRAVGAPDVLKMLFTSMVVTKPPPQFFSVGPTDYLTFRPIGLTLRAGSNGTPLRGLLTAGRSPHALIGRDKFDLQILNARLREIDDAQNPLVVQAVVDGQEQRALFCGPAAQDLRHARGQFGCRDLLIRQGHLTVLRDPLLCRRPEDGARRGPDAQDQLRFGGLRRRIGGGSRDVDVIALYQEWDDDHEDDQQHEHHVDERRDVDFGLQTGAGIVAVELHDVTFLLRRRAWRSAPPRGSRPARSRAWPPGPGRT